MAIEVVREDGSLIMGIGGDIRLRPGSRIAVREDGTVEVAGVHLMGEVA